MKIKKWVDLPDGGANMTYELNKKEDKALRNLAKEKKKIYNANTDVLKAPNKIYSGQTIVIPSQEMQEVPANLK